MPSHSDPPGDTSRKAFVADALTRSLDCGESLYALGDPEMIAGWAEHAGRLQTVLAELHDRMRERWLRCLTITTRGREIPADSVWFHPRFGWIGEAGGDKVFLGKVRLFEEKKITLGRRSYLSGANMLRGRDHLEIGSFCSMGEELFLNTSADFHPSDLASTFAFWGEPRDEAREWEFHQPFEQIETAKTGIVIGNDVWIARRVRLFHGVEIGNGCVIAEGSLVRGTLEPYGVYAGVPAKLKRFRFPQRIIGQLQALRWWDWERERILRNRAFFNTPLQSFDGDIEDLLVP